MALLEFNFRSQALDKYAGAYVILPEYFEMQAHEGNIKTLYLLHGLHDDYTKWLRRSNIDLYARDAGIAVVIPDGDVSFYTNNIYQERYYDFLTEELPEIIHTTFPYLSSAREDNLIAGLSMGGFGAMKAALNHPDRYCAAASFSGALDLIPMLDMEDTDMIRIIFETAEKVRGTENDLPYLVSRLKNEGADIPRLYISCGTEDFLYEINKGFEKHLKEIGVPHTFEEWPGGHDWYFWDESIKHALKWFFEQD